MEVYINTMSCISPCDSAKEDWFFEDYQNKIGNRFQAIEPDYKEYIPANSSRRMSHVIKMGVAAAQITLKKSEIVSPDAIITGTGLGCFEDTDKFLRAIDDNQEQMLAPTSFIQSTHNTVAGQIALIIKCHNYNFTYVHQGVSFESALFDALLQIKSGDSKNILVGGMDELTPATFEMFERAGHLKTEQSKNSNFGNSDTKGIAMGEGAAFFMLSANLQATSICKIKNVEMINSVSNADELQQRIHQFAKTCDLSMNEFDLVLLGNNGDVNDDKIINTTIASNFNSQPKVFYKEICGEYFTASSFACWLGAKIIARQELPKTIVTDGNGENSIRNLLIINHYRNMEYSLMCLSKC